MNDQDMKMCEYESDEYEDCSCNCSCDKPKKHAKPNRTILKCGSQGGVTLPNGTAAAANFTLATVTVDTRNLKNPCIKLEFASNIITTASILTVNLQIFKQCKGQLAPLPVGPIWTFSRSAATTSSDAFTFFVCDCDICDDDCCTYSVVATVAGVATQGVTAIHNATLSAIIVDNDCF